MDPDPYLRLMDPDPDPGASKHTDPTDPDSDPQNWFFLFEISHGLALAVLVRFI